MATNDQHRYSILPPDVQQLAKLAGIPLAEDFVPRVAAALQEYIDHAERLFEVELPSDTQPAPVLDPNRWSTLSPSEHVPPAADR